MSTCHWPQRGHCGPCRRHRSVVFGGNSLLRPWETTSVGNEQHKKDYHFGFGGLGLGGQTTNSGESNEKDKKH